MFLIENNVSKLNLTGSCYWHPLWKVLWSPRPIHGIYCACQRLLWWWPDCYHERQLNVQTASMLSCQMLPARCKFLFLTTYTVISLLIRSGVIYLFLAHLSRLSWPLCLNAQIQMMSWLPSRLSYLPISLSSFSNIKNLQKLLNCSSPASQTELHTLSSWARNKLQSKVLRKLKIPSELMLVILYRVWKQVHATCISRVQSWWFNIDSAGNSEPDSGETFEWGEAWESELSVNCQSNSWVASTLWIVLQSGTLQVDYTK